MTPVADKVLAWLFNVLQILPADHKEKDYQDPQRTYSDAARTLSAFPSFSPRTEVYTDQNGRSALLLTLSGTLPIDFRGTVYHFPLKSWIPQTYPQDAPMVYVTPARDMLVRPGQHVGVDGRVYHPYLRDWNKMGSRASIAESLDHVQQVFVKEPPVISKAHQQQYQQRAHLHQKNEVAPPQPPPKQKIGGTEPQEVSKTSYSSPPPKPPKPFEHQGQRSSPQGLSHTGPPLPPLPTEFTSLQRYSSPAQSTNGHQMRVPFPHNGRIDAIPPVTNQYNQTAPLPQHLLQRTQSPPSPVSPLARAYEQPQRTFQQMTLPPDHQPANQYNPNLNQPIDPSAYQLHAPSRYSDVRSSPAQHHEPTRRPQAPPDLLSDPFDINIPSMSASGAAPPIPPNPEKEHILHALSVSLVSQAQSEVAQSLTRLGPLQAQERALHAAHARLDNEIQQLEHLSNLLDSNEAILRRSFHDCETIIESAQSKPQPPIDEVLMATTLVAQQLWTLSAEEAGCREAMYVLQKSLDQGRISGEVFIKQMRSLGRERYLKMVLVRKCAKGLGLEMRKR